MGRAQQQTPSRQEIQRFGAQCRVVGLRGPWSRSYNHIPPRRDLPERTPDVFAQTALHQVAPDGVAHALADGETDARQRDWRLPVSRSYTGCAGWRDDRRTARVDQREMCAIHPSPLLARPRKIGGRPQAMRLLKALILPIISTFEAPILF